MKKILGAFLDLPANQHSISSLISQMMTGLAVLVSWQILKGSQNFLHTFSMALYHKCPNGMSKMALPIFSLISHGLGTVQLDQQHLIRIVCQFSTKYVHSLCLTISKISCWLQNYCSRGGKINKQGLLVAAFSNCAFHMINFRFSKKALKICCHIVG